VRTEYSKYVTYAKKMQLQTESVQDYEEHGGDVGFFSHMWPMWLNMPQLKDCLKRIGISGSNVGDFSTSYGSWAQLVEPLALSLDDLKDRGRQLGINPLKLDRFFQKSDLIAEINNFAAEVRGTGCWCCCWCWIIGAAVGSVGPLVLLPLVPLVPVVLLLRYYLAKMGVNLGPPLPYPDDAVTRRVLQYMPRCM
jgi:hypothetical protein